MLDAFCITSNHLEVTKKYSVHFWPFDVAAMFSTESKPCWDSPGRVLLLLGLHHVAEASVGQSLGEVGVGRHEAVVVEARPQAGRAQAQGFALGATGAAQDALVLGRQVGAEQSLEQLETEGARLLQLVS